MAERFFFTGGNTVFQNELNGGRGNPVLLFRALLNAKQNNTRNFSVAAVLLLHVSALSYNIFCVERESEKHI